MSFCQPLHCFTELMSCVKSRIQSANILLITFKALANEVAKNLVLTGIGNLTIVDHEPVTEEDLSAQFFVEEKHLGQNVCSIPSCNAA